MLRRLLTEPVDITETLRVTTTLVQQIITTQFRSVSLARAQPIVLSMSNAQTIIVGLSNGG
jgi:hypothetical protein